MRKLSGSSIRSLTYSSSDDIIGQLSDRLQGLASDISQIMTEYNAEVYSTLSGPAKGTSDTRWTLDNTTNAKLNGLDGRSLFVDTASTSVTDSGRFWNTTKARPKTLKDAIGDLDIRLTTEINALQTTINSFATMTKADLGLDNVTNDAQLKRSANDLNSFSNKVIPNNNDIFIIEDSESAYAKKTVTWSQLPNVGGDVYASNVGIGGVGIYKEKDVNTFKFKTVNAGSSKVTITDDVGNDEVDVDIVEANISHANISGIGTNSHTTIDSHIANVTTNPHSVTKTNVGLSSVTNDAQLKRAASDFASFANKVTPVSNDVLLIEDSEDATPGTKKYITISSLPSGGGTITGAANAGTGGVGPYDSVVAGVIQLKNLNAGSSKVTITNDAVNKEIDIDITEANISHANITGIGTNSHTTIDSHIANVTTNPHSVTKTNVGLGNVTDDSQLKRAAGDFGSFSEKNPAIAADILLLEDSADGTNKKKVQVQNLAGAIAHQSLSGAGTTTHANIDIHVGSTSNPHSVTKAQVGLTNVTDYAQLTREDNDWDSFGNKGSPVSADRLLIEDSEDTLGKKYITWSQLPAGGGGALVIKEEGVQIEATCTEIDFIGDSITAASVSAGKVSVTVSGSGGGLTEDEVRQICMSLCGGL